MALSPEAKKARAEYMKKYRQRPGMKERQKEYQERYWQRKACVTQPEPPKGA